MKPGPETNKEHQKHFELIRKIAAGDESSLKLLYDEFSTKVYNTALSYLQDISEAEEITQDVFLQIYNSASTFKEKSSVSTWIYRITVNKSLDRIKYYKRKKRISLAASFFIHRDEDELKNVSDFLHPAMLHEQKEESKLLFTAINNLPDGQKTAFILRHIENLPQKEIADITKLSVKAVEALLQRAKHNLRKELNYLFNNRRKL